MHSATTPPGALCRVFVIPHLRNPGTCCEIDRPDIGRPCPRAILTLYALLTEQRHARAHTDREPKCRDSRGAEYADKLFFARAMGARVTKLRVTRPWMSCRLRRDRLVVGNKSSRPRLIPDGRFNAIAERQ